MALEIVQATTPTFILRLPSKIDTSIMQKMVFTIVQGDVRVVKEVDPSSIEGNCVRVYLTQPESLRFSEGIAKLMLNWTYADGKRGCTKKVQVAVDSNLLPEVI